jgi:hypothetical protein
LFVCFSQQTKSLLSWNFHYCETYRHKKFLLCWVRVHCGIYKSPFNISNVSYLNSPPPLLSFTRSHTWKSFNRSHFSIYIHVYTVFALYLLSHTLSLPPPHSHWHQPPLSPDRICSILLFFDFVKE